MKCFSVHILIGFSVFLPVDHLNKSLQFVVKAVIIVMRYICLCIIQIRLDKMATFILSCKRSTSALPINPEFLLFIAPATP